MNQEFLIPKLTFTARVELEGQPAATLTLFLGESAATHTGHQRLSDLLNGPRSFLPALNGEGAFFVLNRDTIRTVEVAAEGQETLPGPLEINIQGNSQIVPVEVTMNDGIRLHGTIEYDMPEARRRIQDYLNRQSSFVELKEGKVSCFINTRYITLVTVYDRMQGSP